jgi:hypothetical protein
MVKLIQTVFLLTFFSLLVSGQSSTDLKFINYLIEKGEFKDAIHVCNQTGAGWNASVRDSLLFFKGWSFYSIKSLDSASLFLGEVTESSTLFSRAAFFSAYCHSYQGRYTIAVDQLSRHATTDTNQLGLKNFELAGISLLDRDFKSFEKYSSGFNHSHFAYAGEEDHLKKYFSDLQTHRYKSPTIAGLLSFVLPGSGKIYAGRTAQGISSMFVTLTMGAMATENIVKSGWKSPQSILFSGLFSIFYIGNIYGSIFAVKYVNNAYDQNINGHLLLDMHLPLRNFFR